MVGGYDDGIYAWTAADWRRFPNAVQVHISAVGSNVGEVGDVESGCIWPPSQAVPWVRMRRAAGADPTIYCNQTYGWGPVRAAFRAAGVAEPHYWVANYDGVAVVPPGAVAKQYANPTITGRHYDLSVATDFWPGVDGLHGGGGGIITGDDMTPEQDALQKRIDSVLENLAGRFFGVNGSVPVVQNQLNAIQKGLPDAATIAILTKAAADLTAAAATIKGSGAILTPTQAQQLANCEGSLTRLEQWFTAFKKA